MEQNFDYKRHFSELYRVVLPIFGVVAILAMVLWAMFGPQKKETQPVEFEERVGLLYAGDGGQFDPAFATVSSIELASAPIANRFDAPMGSEHFGLTYNAQPFLTTRHLGDDLNGIGGEDSDLGDPVYAVAEGKVVYAAWPSDGWGNIVILLHQLPDGTPIETFYAHLKSSFVHVGQDVRRGEQIGTVGKADGRYLAHLHYEMRKYATVSPGQGYADSALGRLSGEAILRKWRTAPDDQLNGPVTGVPDEEVEGNGLNLGAEQNAE